MSKFSFVPRATALAAATFALSLSATAPAVAGPAVMSGPSTSSPGCGSGPLTAYQGTGMQGCMVGPATFYNFSQAFEYLNNSNTDSGSNPAGAINVAPGAASSLAFSSDLFHRTANQGAADYYFEYYIDPPIDILGFRLEDLPFVNSYAEASVCVGATFNSSLRNGFVPAYGGGEGAPTFSGAEGSSPQDTCSFSAPARPFANTNALAAADPQYYYFNISDTNPIDAQIFTTPDLFADVMIHVHIGPGGSIDDFKTGAIVAVPEPEEMALTGLGGLVMAGTFLRRRRRSSTAPA